MPPDEVQRATSQHYRRKCITSSYSLYHKQCDMFYLEFQRRDIAMVVIHVILLIIPHLQIILLQVQNIEMGLPSIDLKDFKASHVT